MNELFHNTVPLSHLVLRGGCVYIAVILLLRLSGKRQVGQLGISELVALLLISNAVQNAMNGGDNSLTAGLVLAVVIVGLSVLFHFLSFRSRRWETLLQGRPTLLIHNGEAIAHNLEREHLSLRELHALLRRQGVHEVHHVREGVLESNGALSLTLKTDSAPPPK